MAKLPRDADARKVVRALGRMGFQVTSVSGSHYKLVHESDPARILVVPFHGKLKTGTLAAILKAARVKVDEFLKVFTIL